MQVEEIKQELAKLNIPLIDKAQYRNSRSDSPADNDVEVPDFLEAWPTITNNISFYYFSGEQSFFDNKKCLSFLEKISVMQRLGLMRKGSFGVEISTNEDTGSPAMMIYSQYNWFELKALTEQYEFLIRSYNNEEGKWTEEVKKQYLHPLFLALTPEQIKEISYYDEKGEKKPVGTAVRGGDFPADQCYSIFALRKPMDGSTIMRNRVPSNIHSGAILYINTGLPPYSKLDTSEQTKYLEQQKKLAITISLSGQNKESLASHKPAELLKDFPAICVGEIHNHFMPKKYIIDNMLDFNKAGAKHLFLEHFFPTQQAMLDHFFHTGELAIELDIYIDKLNEEFYLKDSYPNNFRGLIYKAREAGIKCVAIESNISYSISSGLASTGQEHIRYSLMNHAMLKKIEQYCPEGEKYIILTGSAHVKTQNNIPGIAEVLAIPAIVVEDSKKSDKIEYDVDRGNQHIRADVLITANYTTAQSQKILPPAISMIDANKILSLNSPIEPLLVNNKPEIKKIDTPSTPLLREETLPLREETPQKSSSKSKSLKTKALHITGAAIIGGVTLAALAIILIAFIPTAFVSLGLIGAALIVGLGGLAGGGMLAASAVFVGEAIKDRMQPQGRNETPILTAADITKGGDRNVNEEITSPPRPSLSPLSSGGEIIGTSRNR